MADEILELDPSSQNGDQGGDLTPEVELEQPVPEDVDALKKRLNNAEAHISDLKKAAGVNSVRELKDKFAPKPVEKTETKNERGEYVTREELALLNRGYTTDEIEVAKKLAPAKSLAEAVNDPVAKAAITGIRQTRKASDTVLEPSDRTPFVQGKTFQELPKPEQQRNYTHAFQSLVDKARRKERSPGR